MSLSLTIFNAITPMLPSRGLFGLRRYWLRRSGIEIGKGARIAAGARFYDRYIEVGAGTWIGPESSFFSTHEGHIRIGSNVDIAPACKFFAGTHKLGDTTRRAGAGAGDDIVVGDGCWIGGAARILPGSVIGPGCVVAAGAVVRKGEYPSNVLLAGVPATIAKNLDRVEESVR